MMRWVRRSLQRVALMGIAVCILSFAIIGANPRQVAADVCSINGRDCYVGYFSGAYDGGPGTLRWNVLSAPALLNIWDTDSFINWIGGYMSCAGGVLLNAGAQNATGAAFIVLTMLGYPPGTPKDVACQQFGTWAQIVSDLRNFTQFGVMYDYGGLNTRSTLTDVAWYPSAQTVALSIVFYSPVDGTPMYAIKKDCGNPVGAVRAIVRNYDLSPSVSATVNGSNVSSAEPGQSITFTYNIINNGNTNSTTGVNCWGGSFNRVGYFQTPPTPEGGGTPLALGCPRQFGGGVTQVGSEVVTAVANRTYCRTLFVDPATAFGGTRGTEVCIPVVSKPYLKVYGGDVSAGGGFASVGAPTACTPNGNANIVAWNQLAGGGYAGAGTQYAAYALSRINGFATAQRSAGAPTPIGLSFANNSVDTVNGNFGGSFGSVPCIRDFYGMMPTSGVIDLSSGLSNGTRTYRSTSSTTFSGAALQPGDKWTIYIDGDLYITGNITFAGSWPVASMPMLEVVVRGNIYIASGVTRLDGSYIAQPDTAGGRGNIYTCTTSAAPPSLTGGAFYTACNNKLTINGSFTARDVWFLRTRGTLSQSPSNEGSGSATTAEEFNYSPAAWMAQPPSTNESDGQIDNYDAITSLPPVL
ncbi:MAG TPA: hypothetical protein VF733_02595 [Candidatus Saccharimonadales bacterium]